MRDQAEKLRQLVRNLPEKDQSADAKNRDIAANGEKRSRVIAVTSGKGGVGKTNFTVNAALALADLGQNVLIIDADLGVANVDVLLGASPTYNLLDLVEKAVDIDDIITKGPRGIRFISGGSGIYRLANLSQEQLQKINRQITLYDDWADFILIDTGAGINRNVISFLMAADEVIIITTPEPTAITDAYAVMKAYAANNGSAPLKLIINRVIDPGEGEVVAEKLIQVALRFLKLQTINLGNVYEDPNLIRAVKSRTPVLLSHPSSISARCIENIAGRLLQLQSISQSSGIKGFFDKFLKML